MSTCRYRVVHVESDDVLWVRTEANVKSAKIIAIPHDAKGIQVTGDEVKSGKSSWVPVEYKGIE